MVLNLPSKHQEWVMQPSTLYTHWTKYLITDLQGHRLGPSCMRCYTCSTLSIKTRGKINHFVHAGAFASRLVELLILLDCSECAMFHWMNLWCMRSPT